MKTSSLIKHEAFFGNPIDQCTLPNGEVTESALQIKSNPTINSSFFDKQKEQNFIKNNQPITDRHIESLMDKLKESRV